MPILGSFAYLGFRKLDLDFFDHPLQQFPAITSVLGIFIPEQVGLDLSALLLAVLSVATAIE